MIRNLRRQGATGGSPARVALLAVVTITRHWRTSRQCHLARCREIVLVGLLIAMLSVSLGTAAAADDLKEGQPAPDFTATGQDGMPWKLSQHKGKQPVVLVFARAHW
jgi:hypothetical protein